MTGFFARWITTALAVLVSAHVVNGVSYDTTTALLVAALVLSLVNAFLKPILMLLSLPALLLTFGLFLLVINAFLFWFVGYVVRGFHVDSGMSAFLGALIVSVTSFFLNTVLYSNGRVTLYRGRH